MEDSVKKRWPRLKPWTLVVALATLGGALVVFTQLASTRRWISETWAHRGAVELPGSYPGEVWKPAKVEQFAWLQDEWCFPSVPGFRSRFRIEGGTLERRNQSSGPQPFVSEWVSAEVHISNGGLLRVDYEHRGWPNSFVQFTPGNTAEWQENERYVQEDRTTMSGDQRLVVSCSRCRVAADGETYSCGGGSSKE